MCSQTKLETKIERLIQMLQTSSTIQPTIVFWQFEKTKKKQLNCRMSMRKKYLVNKSMTHPQQKENIKQ